MTISDYQLQRVHDISKWYENVFRPLDGHAPESIRYMALWAVFNALYNIADYPKVVLRGVLVDDGKVKPYIRGRDEDKKLRFISRCFIKDDPFTASLVRDNREFITYLSQRRPEVQQPEGMASIQFEHAGKCYKLDLSNLHGIASLDNRLFLKNREVLYQYHHLDLEFCSEGLPKDRQKFYRQLLYMLYQLRNNIVHGGSASFFMHKTKLTGGAIKLLDTLVQYLFRHTELLQQEKA